MLDATAQRPDPGTPADAALQLVMSHYKTGGDWSGVGEHRFEGMASEIVGAYLNENGRYRRGWITKRGGDGGVDFVGRLDLGAAESGLKLVVLGQAKCKTGGTLARTSRARLPDSTEAGSVRSSRPATSARRRSARSSATGSRC